MNAKNLALIVPCYNEYLRMPFETFRSFLKKNDEVFLCFVDDASTDLTLTALIEIEISFPDRVKILHSENNLGKAESIRLGVHYISTKLETVYIAFIDADLSSPLEELMRLFEIMIARDSSFVFGSRVAIYGSNIKRCAMRHYSGRIFATFASLLLDLPIYDTQCGLKIFKRDLAIKLFITNFTSRWLFDIELFARLKQIYNPIEMKQVIREIPLNEWVEKGSSKIKFTDILTVPFLLIKIHYRYNN